MYCFLPKKKKKKKKKERKKERKDTMMLTGLFFIQMRKTYQWLNILAKGAIFYKSSKLTCIANFIMESELVMGKNSPNTPNPIRPKLSNFSVFFFFCCYRLEKTKPVQVGSICRFNFLNGAGTQLAPPRPAQPTSLKKKKTTLDS